MKLNRRSLLKAGALASLSGSAAARAATQSPALIVFDSRLPASRAFAARQAGARIDLAHQDAEFWRALRAASPEGRISGLTRWSDWVAVRGLLEEKGKRLRAERRTGLLFQWEMA